MEILKKTAALRVQKQTEGKSEEEVTSISLSGVPVLPELWSHFTHLTQLLLVCMKPKLGGLDSIGLQHLPTLRTLDVSDNAVAVPAALPAVPSLARLLMPNNRVADMAEVDRLAASFPNVEVLDLVDNDVDTPAHFTAVFERFPKLIALNSRTRDGTEVVVEDSDESESEEEEEEEEEESESEEEEGGVAQEASSDDADGDSNDELPRKKPRQD
jgi:acidic leucine-rich nuclear phosphoprotein 32 family member A/C/D